MYTMQRFLVVMIGAALTSIAGAQSLPYQSPPDASSYQGPAPDAPPAYGNTAPALNDPPGRVARLSYLTGAVSFTPAGEENWVQAQLNRPVVTGDRLWVDADAHAELSLGPAIVRLDRGSSFDFLNLDDQYAQMELTQGTLSLDVNRLRGNETYEVDTPTIAFIATRAGDYRINVEPNGGTVVTAWRGGGDAIGEGGKRVTIEEGQSVRFNDSQLNDLQVTRIDNGIGPRDGIGTRNAVVAHDEFDNFVGERRQRYASASHQYVSEDVVGYEDLDQYGSWEAAPQYGHVWYPREVATNWAPYHDGHWAWIDPWGWTWVDNAPWGYAPSHYGRWAYVGSRWGWVPGPVHVAPVYAPAFVAFVGGGGGGISVGFSVGGPVGWFALGPSDVYFPSYRCGQDYFGRINYGSAYVSHTVVNNYYGGWSNGSLDYSQVNYVNRDAPRAMTAMRGDAFVAGQPVSAAAIAVNRETFANARVTPRANLMPTRESLVAGRGRAAAPPAAAINRTVIAANRPAPTAPSFEQRQTLLQRNNGQALTRNQMRTLATQTQQQAGNARVAATNNVRVVGNNKRGNAVTAQAAAEASTKRGTAGATAETNARAVPNNGRVAGQSPSRAPEMNRSPERANAQYQRSAGFAHDGVVPGSERATNAQQGRTKDATRETAQSRENAQTRNMPQQSRSEQANRANAPKNAQHLNSSTFAHGGQNARGTQQGETADANARNNAQQRERTATANAARENAQARNNAVAQQNARDNARAQGSASKRAEPNARAESNARAEANARSQANARSEANARASANARAAESARQSRTAQSRAAEQRSAAAEQSRASSQARAQQQREQQQRAQQQRTAPENRPTYAQQRSQAPQQQQREAPTQQQRSQERRAQPQVAQSPPPQRSERSQPQQQAQQRAPVQRSEPRPQPQVVQAPQQQERAQQPQQQQQRAQQQRQVARSAPQQQQQPQPQRQPAPKKSDKDKEKDKDDNGGG